MREQVGQFTRRLTFGRAYDLGQRFGIQSMIMQFALTGPLGAVNWSISTNWWLEAQRRQSADMYSRYPFDVIELVAPRATGIGYHARVAQYPTRRPARAASCSTGGPVTTTARRCGPRSGSRGSSPGARNGCGCG